MAIDGDYLLDRKRLKRKLTLWRAVAIVSTILVGLILANGLKKDFSGAGHIAVLKISGIIRNNPDLLSLIQKARDDDSTKALLVHVNSPGGTIVGGETLYRALRQFAEKKPVVAVMGDLATSAGYMVAIAADRVFAQNGTVTGSIGVLLQSAEITTLLSRLGITVETIKSGLLKGTPGPLEKMIPETRAASQAMVNDMFSMFTEMVANRRKMDLERVKTLSDGRVFSGRMALNNGLIDAIGGQREAKIWLESERSISKDLPSRILNSEKDMEGWLKKLSGFTEKLSLSERLTLDGLVSVWHPYD
ncbi:MAG: signal peptide peptidase SppA [Rhodospirillaceae bacterium]|nr:signal peptide peptidase SppA [Rhodospirillaceae bacterium]